MLIRLKRLHCSIGSLATFFMHMKKGRRDLIIASTHYTLLHAVEFMTKFWWARQLLNSLHFYCHSSMVLCTLCLLSRIMHIRARFAFILDANMLLNTVLFRKIKQFSGISKWSSRHQCSNNLLSLGIK